MGYATTPTQRAQILAAVQRMCWSDCRGVPLAPALRVVAAAVLASAAVGRSNRRVADPLRCAIQIGIARLPDGKPLVGLDDGHDRHYLLDLGNEAISVLIESSEPRAGSRGRDPALRGDPCKPCGVPQRCLIGADAAVAK
jgi:hypothetical protein